MASADLLNEWDKPISLPKPLPKLVVFDLDYTLWPLYADMLYDLDYKQDGKGGVVGLRGSDRLKLFPDTRRVLGIVSDAKIPIAAASRSDDPPMARKLLELFEIDKFFSYKEIYHGSKVNHFKQFHKASRVSYQEMLFFDDEDRNIHDVSKLGVTCVLVGRGINKKLFIEGLEQFAKQASKI